MIRFANLVSVGLTGTRQGMTFSQRNEVARIVEMLNPRCVAHHGCCEGADMDFDAICRRYGIRRHLHPGCNSRGDTPTSVLPPDNESYVLEQVLPYLVRDKIIAERVELLIGIPKGYDEEQRSGTWTTIRMRRKTGLPILVIYPDGVMSYGYTGQEKQGRLL